MSLTLITPAAAEPVALADAKAHLKVSTADEDSLITALIGTARARVEWHTGRALVTQSWVLRLDHWPADGVAEIPLPPLQAVTEVALYTTDNARAVLACAAYDVDAASQPARLFLVQQKPPLRRHDAVEIAFRAGYGAASAVPAAIKQAILDLVGDLYSHRGDDNVVCSAAAEALLAPYRILKL